MSTSTHHPLQSFYRRELEKALLEFKALKVGEFYDVSRVIWWLLKYENLIDYAYNHRHVGSCLDGMGCLCCSNTPESNFSSLYTSLVEVESLYKYESYFQHEMKIYERDKGDKTLLKNWLIKNRALGSDELLLFWIDWYEEEEDLIRPYISGDNPPIILFKAREWNNTIKFCEAFNESYWTSEACPPI